jgi:hypothetical protein
MPGFRPSHLSALSRYIYQTNHASCLASCSISRSAVRVLHAPFKIHPFTVLSYLSFQLSSVRQRIRPKCAGVPALTGDLVVVSGLAIADFPVVAGVRSVAGIPALVGVHLLLGFPTVVGAPPVAGVPILIESLLLLAILYCYRCPLFFLVYPLLLGDTGVLTVAWHPCRCFRPICC